MSLLIRRGSRVATMLVASGAATALLVTLPAAGALAAPTAPSAASAPSGATHTVTLLTGDVVHVTDVGGGRTSTTIERPEGAVGGVRASTIGGHLYVLPDEVLPYLAAQRVDRRLFDVTGLIAQGYDDAHSGGIPLIVGYTSNAAAARASVPGADKARTLSSVHAAAMRATKQRTRSVWRALAPGSARPTPERRTATTYALTPPQQTRPAVLADGVERVWLDGKVRTTLAESTAQIGAPAAWAAGLDGRDVKVAVLDTGYDDQHPDLQGRVSEARSFVPGETVHDGNGHGTHVASTVGGSGAASGGAEKGVAPGADLIVGKVLADGGYGEDSWVIEGMEWAVAQGAKVVSMSLGGSVPSDGSDPVCQAVEQISAQSKALFVVAAGNAGGEATLSCPGAADSALTVAAVDSSDTLAWFSSRGPRSSDYALKPDVAAPGVDILAAKAGGNDADGWYQTLSGTSMATPHVSGAAAVLAQQHPDWTGRQLKDALMSTSHALPDFTAYEVGAGRIDLAVATTETVSATGSVYFGKVVWPHPDPQPVGRTVTYANSGDEAVTLQLQQTMKVAGGPYDSDPTADAGTPAPDGMFGLSAGSVTVPGHGTATVSTWARPALGQDGRRYLGQLVATDATGVVRGRTQVGLYVEDERYTLHLRVKDRDGAPTSADLELQRFGVADVSVVSVDSSGSLDLRLQPGTYSVTSYLEVPGSHGPDSRGVALLGVPEVVLDRDRTVELDARRAREVSAQVPQRAEDRTMYLDWYRSDGGVSTFAGQYLLPSYDDTMYALPTARVTRGSFEFMPRWRKAYPLLTVRDGSTALRTFGVAGTSWYDGRTRADVVVAGAGGPGDYDGLHATGAVALVRAGASTDVAAQAEAAADAGVALLLVVNDRDAPLLTSVYRPDGSYSRVPVATLTASTGEALIARAQAGRVHLDLEGVPSTPFVYDLVDPHPGRIPGTLTYRPKTSQLQRVDVRFHGTSEAEGAEFRWDFRPYRPTSFAFMQRQPMPTTRTDYLSAQPGVQWSEAAATGPVGEWNVSSEPHPAKAGTHTVRDFFGPVVRPRNGGGFWSSTRYSGSAALNVQPWADGGPGQAGYLVQGDALHMVVDVNGKRVTESDWASANLWPLDDGPLSLRMDLTATRDGSLWRTSTRTHTVWQVRSPGLSNGADSMDLLPVLQVDYDVASDLSGDVSGGAQTVGLRVSHLVDAYGAGRVGAVSAWVSFDDGAHWRPVHVDPTAPGAGVARFDAPRSGFVSLKVAASDGKGNSVRQEVVRAYALR